MLVTEDRHIVSSLQLPQKLTSHYIYCDRCRRMNRLIKRPLI